MKELLQVFCLFIFIYFSVYFFLYLSKTGKESQDEYYNKIINEGRNAFILDIPPQANPYKDTMPRKRWLEGYMLEKQDLNNEEKYEVNY